MSEAGAISRSRMLFSRAIANLRRSSLGFKLVLFSTALTALVICAVFLVLGMQIRDNTRRLFTSELIRSQRSFVDQQRRSLAQLNRLSTQITEIPTLRAAIETYRLEASSGEHRAELLATINLEVAKIADNLGNDLLVVTDEGGRILASSTVGDTSLVGRDLAAVPAMQKALAADGEMGFGLASIGGTRYQVSAVPILLRDYLIGTLVVGERLTESFMVRMKESVNGEIVLVTGEEVIGSSFEPPREPPIDARALLRSIDPASSDPGVVLLGEEEFVGAPLILGIDEQGQPVLAYLLRSLSASTHASSESLRGTFLIYGILAVMLSGLGALMVNRTVLSPFTRFVEFVRSVAGTRRHHLRFDDSMAPAEIRTLNVAHEQLVASLAEKHAELLLQSQELSETNRVLVQQIHGRERAENALQEREEQLRQSQKLEAIGTLAGGVAHDFNNLLTVISGYTSLMLAASEPGSEERGDLEQVLQAAKRAGGLTSQLLAFSRRQVLQPKVLDLNGIVTGIETMLGRLIGEHIEIQTIVRSPLHHVKADPGQLEQVIVNLAVNARDAMPTGGKLTIETANIDSGGPVLPGSAPVMSWVRLTVSDSGIGMDQETQARIFEPFFTTKPIGKGTGLGLSTVYGIVTQSGGTIRVESVPGKGTSFAVYLPAVNDDGAHLESAHLTPVPLAGSETILLVEDELMVRQLAQRSLRRAGYQVLSAGNGAEALDVAQQYREKIHLLITDVVMPSMGGKELADRLLLERPDVAVLYMSGYTDDTIAQHGALCPGMQLLPKPFIPDTLTRKVREVLDLVLESRT
jgi:signal transduction histidine kinase/CheY-like chemotaxis protein